MRPLAWPQPSSARSSPASWWLMATCANSTRGALRQEVPAAVFQRGHRRIELGRRGRWLRQRPANAAPGCPASPVFVMCNGYDQLRTPLAFPVPGCRGGRHLHAGISIGEDGPSQMRDIPRTSVWPARCRTSPWSCPRMSLNDDQAVHALGRHQDARPTCGRRTARRAECCMGPSCRVRAGQGQPAPRRQGSDDHRQRSDGWGRPRRRRSTGDSRNRGAAGLDMHTVKPLDDAAVLSAAKETGRILVAEEHLLHGGLGSVVAMSVVVSTQCRCVSSV